jgi:hypothetical protein
MKALIRTLLFLPLPLMFAGCDREELPLREDSLYAHPARHFPGSDPGVTPPGGSSSTSSDTMTNPPAQPQPGTTAGESTPPAGAGGQAAGSTSGGSTSRPTAGGQGKPQDKETKPEPGKP